MSEVEKKVLINATIADNFIKAADNLAKWKKELKEVRKIIPSTDEECEGLAESQLKIAKGLAAANNQYREAKKAIEGSAKSAELLNEITSKTNKTLGEMQRELMALRNTPFEALKEADAKAIKQRMADLTADIQDYKNEIKGLDTGEFFANATEGIQAIVAGTQALGQGLNAMGIESEVFDKIQNSTVELIGATQALGVVSEYLEKSKWKLFLANAKNVAIMIAEKVAALGSSAALLIMGSAANTASVGFKVLRAALISTGIGALIVGVGLLIANLDKLGKWFGLSSDTTKAAAKSQQAYEKQVQKTQDAIDAISRRQEDSSKKAELIGRAEILELKKNGASKEAIAKREAQMAQELRDIEIKASKDKETTKRAELKSSDNNLAKQKALLATHRVGSKAYEEQLKVVNDLIRARNELVGVINKELNAQSELSLKSAEDKQADKDASAEKRKAAYMKSLDAQQKFEEAQLNAQKKYRNDSTKTDAENNALKFQHEQTYDKQMFALKQQSEQKKLEAQRKFGDITKAEYQQQIELLQLQQTEFDNTQADKTAEFFDARKKEIIGMIGQDAEAQISDIKANYSQAMKELQAEPNMSKDKKSFYRAGLIAQQEKEIAQIKEQQASQVNAMLELKYKENLAEYSDNERKKLGIEMKITEEAITEKKAKGLSTLDDEAKLRAQKMQLSQIQLNDELLQAQGNLDKQYEIKKAAFAREQEIYKDNADKVRDIKAQEATLDAEHTQAKIDNLEMWAGKSMELMGALNELANALGQAEVQKAEEKNSKEKASLDARLKSGKISQEQYDKAIAKSDKELDKKKAEIARKQAIREKMMSITQAIISTSLAVLNGLNTKPYLPMGPIMAASAAALGAIQIATILATPLPKARKGGRIVGNSHEGGGVLIEGEGGEQLVNKYAVAAYPELINLINTIGNTGGRMPDGGYAARAMMRESAALNGGRRVIENTSVMRNQGSAARSEPALDVDYLADRLGEKIENIRVYTAIEDIRKADKMYTQMEQIAKI